MKALVLFLALSIGSTSAAYTCTLTPDGSLTTFGGGSYQVSIAGCEANLYNECSPNIFNVHLNQDKTVAILSRGVSNLISPGGHGGARDVSLNIGTDGTITVTSNTDLPIGALCGLCTAESQDNANSMVDC